MPSVVLNNGVEMPILGLGVYQMSNLAECERSVLDALDVGYRSIDTAAIYGNEEAVGRAVRKSGLPREDIFITTKLWIQRHGYEGAKQAFHESLARLQLDYVDLYLIHQPYGDIYGAWRAMEELYREGRIRAIGVSNFQPDRLMDLMVHHDVPPALNQIEMHPFCQQIEAHAFMSENHVQIESWAPIAQGRFGIFENEQLRLLAARHHKTVAQIVLRWLIQRETIVIPKSVRKERIIENFGLFDFQLSADEMTTIATLDTKKPMFDPRVPESVKWLSDLRVND